MDSEIVMHSGGCHCKRVRWKVEASTSVVAWQCNCSDCSMRGNTHFVVQSQKFELNEDSKQFLTTYTFGTHTAKHIFCKVCGITSFYIPRSNPDGVAITYRCVDPGTIKHVETRQFDGQNWESSFDQTGISSCSKVVQKGQSGWRGSVVEMIRLLKDPKTQYQRYLEQFENRDGESESEEEDSDEDGEDLVENGGLKGKLKNDFLRKLVIENRKENNKKNVEEGSNRKQNNDEGIVPWTFEEFFAKNFNRIAERITESQVNLKTA